VGAEVWVKHENHLPTGAFKVRGGLTYLDRLGREQPRLAGVITSTRGNHGQSIGFAASRAGIPATIVVPHGNSREKNRAMQAQGVTLVEQGHDYQAAREWATGEAERSGLHMVPPWHPWLVEGVASCALELFRTLPDLHTVYVPVGMGSGICGVIAARDALALATRIVGVVADGAPAYALSFRARQPVPTDTAETFADGIATRSPDSAALEMILHGVERMVTVSDPQIREAMRCYFTDTHQVAEGAGAAPLAALLQERAAMRGRKVALVLSGGNVDRELYARVLGEAD
jgi:threonine dehydratase